MRIERIHFIALFVLILEKWSFRRRFERFLFDFRYWTVCFYETETAHVHSTVEIWYKTRCPKVASLLRPHFICRILGKKEVLCSRFINYFIDFKFTNWVLRCRQHLLCISHYYLELFLEYLLHQLKWLW